jgi:hypothetical protein
MYQYLKTLHPGGILSPGSSVLEADLMTTKPVQPGLIFIYLPRHVRAVVSEQVKNAWYNGIVSSCGLLSREIESRQGVV